MKVLHVIPSLSAKHGGPSIALPLMARALTEAGVGVDVLTTDDDGPGGRLAVPLGERQERDNWGLYHFRKQSEFYKVSWGLRRWVSRHVHEYDLVHVHALFSHTSICAGRAAQRGRIPYIIRPLGVLNQWGRQNRRPFLKRLSMRYLEMPLLRNAGAVHYTSGKEQMEAETIGAFGPGAIIPLGIDHSALATPPGPELFVNQFPQTIGKRLVLFLSRVDAKKGLDLLLPAFAAITNTHPDTLLVIAGDGERQLVERLQRMAAELQLADRIVWTGFLKGQLKLSAFQAATCFVLPSYSENFGIALVEALALAVPCITTDGVGIADDLKHSQAALVVPCAMQPLAEALRCILSDAALRVQLARNGQSIARNRFSLRAMGSALRELYEQILAGRFKHQTITTQSGLN